MIPPVRPQDMAALERMPPGWVPIPSNRLEQFPHAVGHGRCRYLIAPMARVERGLNIVDREGRSLLHVACLVNRPVPVMEDPPVLLSLVNSLAYRRRRPGPNPAAELERLRIAAGQIFADIRSGQGYVKSLGEDVKLAVVAEILTRLIQLGGRTRLRPILMTSIATMLGLVPMAMGMGDGGELQAPLARVVIGGLLTSTMITMVFVPAMYTLFEEGWRGIFKRSAVAHAEEAH